MTINRISRHNHTTPINSRPVKETAPITLMDLLNTIFNFVSHQFFTTLLASLLFCASIATYGSVQAQNTAPTLDSEISKWYVTERLANGPTPIELQELVAKFIAAYEEGEMNLLKALFYEHAKTNDGHNLLSIKRDYKHLFSRSSDRQLFIKTLIWSIDGNLAKGKGELHVLIIFNNGSINSMKGNIQLVAEKIKNKTLITHLYHYNMKVN